MKNTFFGSKSARRTAANAVEESARYADAVNSAASANSAGASTTAAEFSREVDKLVDTLDQNERLSIEQQNTANRLKKTCEEYMEGRIPTGLPNWQSTTEVLELVKLAADCADAAYQRKERFDAPGITRPAAEYKDVKHLPASLDGVVKAACVKLHIESDILIVAIRGTAANIDWITNVNATPIKAEKFFPSASPIQVHPGFLLSAEHILEDIEQAVMLHKDKVKQILFTGHSAGAAIALLLFAHFKMAYTFGWAEQHCITFAAPPVTRPALTDYGSVSNNSHILSFAAYGDPVVRTDRPYAKTLTEIYMRPNPSTPIQFKTPELHNAGTILLLYDRNADEEESDFRISNATKRLQSLLSGNLKAHPMKHYLALLSGWLHQNNLDNVEKQTTVEK